MPVVRLNIVLLILAITLAAPRTIPAASEAAGKAAAAESFKETLAVLEREIAQLQQLLEEMHAARAEESEKNIQLVERLRAAELETEDLREAIRHRDMRMHQLQSELQACEASLEETGWAKQALEKEERGARSSDQKLWDANRKLNIGRVPEAERLFRDVLSAHPASADARLGLAICYYSRRNLPEAKRLVNDVLKVDSRNSHALGLSGMIAYHEGKPASASALLERALRIQRDDPQLHNYMGIVMHARRRDRVALRHFREAVELDPGFEEAQYNLATLLATVDPVSISDARIHYETALSLGRKRDANLEAILYP